MIPKECKRLAEVDFPIAEVSKHAAREKSIRHGHPSTLHLWWARRPLASSRAMLMALLLPDPVAPLCPPAFKSGAREALLAMRSRPSGWNAGVETDDGLRNTLLRFIADFANWDNAGKADYLETGRALVRAAHPEETPLVVDPFAGGGSIPLEALRLGCETFASDLNPVACLILKVMLEDIPRHGPGLVDELRRVGAEIKAKAKEELADLYPKDPDGATPIAYLWTRTVRCEAPNCGAEIPLMRSLWLAKKPKRKRALRTSIVREGGAVPRVEFEIFEPQSEREVAGGTVARARATCLCCGAVLPPERVRIQLAAQRGGADTVFDEQGNRTGGARMTTVVTLKPGEQRRHYRLPTDHDYAAVSLAQQRVAEMLDEWERGGRQGLCPVPDEPISLNEIRRISVPIYGMTTWGDLFTARQKSALVTLGILTAKADTIAEGLVAISVNKTADLGNSVAPWKPDAECPVHMFSRQAIGMTWDFAESVPIGDASGAFESAYQRTIGALESFRAALQSPGQVQSADATDHPLPDQTAAIWFTDPPYYDSVPYAHLSDFFFVWLRRVVPNDPLFYSPADTESIGTPKQREIVVDRPHHLSGSTKDASFYEFGMAEAFAEGRRVLHNNGVGSVVFAHKSTEGWEALLSGMIQAGWTITGSWPIATEMGARLNARETASLATSVHLVCRPRPEDAAVGDWAAVLRELPGRVGDWMQRLEGEGVRGADLVFACIGPALEIYSRYSRVETAEGREVELGEYLEKVWEVVGREALRQVLGTAEAQARNGAAGALEEDARLTALFLWTMQSTAEGAASAGSSDDNGGETDDEDGEAGEDEEEDLAPRWRAVSYSLPFDVARRFAQPLGIHLDDWEDRVIETQKGVVRLLPVAERRRQIFGESGVGARADEIESSAAASPQLSLFPEAPPTVWGPARRRGRTADFGEHRDATTLDRVHAAMLLQASGRTEALRAHLRAEQERGPDFLRLANALTALYPRGSEEKRLLDAMLLTVGR